MFTPTSTRSDTPAVEDVLALSPLQLGLYSMATLNDSLGDGAAGDGKPVDPYVIAMAADIEGALDVELLRRCAELLLIRHPNLRASFFRGDLRRPVQIIPAQVQLPWQHLHAPDRDAALRLESEQLGRPFDLARGPVLRFLLIEMPDSHWRLAVAAHHIVIDGWSLPLFVGELIALYRARGEVTALPPAPRPYRDYIGWLAGRDQDSSRQLWHRHLDGVAGPTLLTPALTAAEPKPGLPRRGEVRLDRAATTELVAAARARGVTVNTLVQFAWANLLSVCTDTHDVVFGVTVSGRPTEIAGVETMVGLFINTVPLRIRLDPGATIGQQCLSLQRDAAELRDHSYLTHAELRALAGVGELFDTLLVYENFPPGGLVGGGEFSIEGATFKPAALESLAHFPVTIAAHLVDDQLTVLVETLDGALGDLRREDLGERLLAVLHVMLEQWHEPLRKLRLFTEPNTAALRGEGPPSAAPWVGGIAQRFVETARQQPDSVAITDTEGALSFAQLDRRTDRLAAALLGRGVGPETPVAVNLPRGRDYVIAMLAVLKAGGMIVPLDPGMPATRIADILAQSGAQIVIDGSWTAADAPDDYAPAPAYPDQAAYAVFTSGTTGKPKGVIGTHGAVLSYAADHVERVLRPAAARLGRSLHIAHAWSFTFDAAWQPLAGLLHGHSIHIVGDELQRDAQGLVDTIAGQGIDMIDTTPSMFAQLRAVGLLDRVPLTVLALGGEAIDAATWQGIRDSCAATGLSAYNCYGPTETTVEAVVATIAEHPAPTIGRPTTGTGVQILDSWLRQVPDGVAGELYLCGPQLTRGYLGRAGETATRFLADPNNPGCRMYRTGDLVRRMPDGGLQYLGRSDDQVKVRGYRVEPGEISTVALTHPAVAGAHVLVRRQRSGPRLTAYLGVGGEHSFELVRGEVRALLAARLPRYLVPHRIVVLDELPLTSHGKVDERALAAADDVASEEPSAAPETATERVLAEVVGELLETDRVDVDADLLALGLDSIVALSVVQAARRRGIALRARLMLECDSIRELAAVIDTEQRDAAASDPVSTPSSEPIPLLPNAHWLYEDGDPRRLAQTEAIRLPDGITGGQLGELLAGLVAGHQVLRCRLDVAALTLVPGPAPDILREVRIGESADLSAVVLEQTRLAVESLDPQAGRLISAVWVHAPGQAGVLVLTAHVLAADPASWRILLGELDAGWHALSNGQRPVPTRERTDYRQWSKLLRARAAALHTRDFWIAQLAGGDPELGARRVQPERDRAGDLQVSMSVADAELTAVLLSSPAPMATLLARAAAHTVTAWRRRRGQPTPTPLLALETHGRAEAVVDPSGAADTGDTLGMFSAIYPVRVDPQAGLPEIPGDGIDYWLLRQLRPDVAPVLAGHPEPQLMLNYLGRSEVDAGSALRLDRSLLVGASLLPEPNLAVLHELTIIAAVMPNVAGGPPLLATQWRTLPAILSADDIAVLQSLWQNALREVAI